MNITVIQQGSEFVAKTGGLERRARTLPQALKALASALEAMEVPPKPYLQKAVLKGVWNLHTTRKVHLFLADDETQARSKADILVLQEHGWNQTSDGLWKKDEEVRTLEEALTLSGEGLLWVKI